MNSLFIGRWQPFHDGHKALIETALKRGKSVVVAIRDTEISEKNPYSAYERRLMIREALKEYGDRVEIIKIPDIDEVLYGREVGYKVEQISLPEEIEAISGTKIREAQKDGTVPTVQPDDTASSDTIN